LVPHLDGVQYFEKPALYYWIVAAAIKFLGYSEWATRTCPAILGLLGCLFTYLTARKLFNRRVGLIAAFTLSSSFLYFSMSHLITMDLPVTFFLTSCLYCFLLAMQYPKSRKRDLLLWTAYIFSGLAVMTKGLIGIVFPAMIIFIWLAITNRWRLLLEIRLLSGLLIVIAINLPWLLLVQQQQPAFLQFYLIDQQFARYATPIASRHMAFASYLGAFVFGFFPWTVLLPQLIKYNLPKAWRERQQHSVPLFLMIWPTAIFLFFAFSHSILIPYLLPIMPPLAILLARYLDSIWQQTANRKLRISVIIFAIICLLLAIALIVLPYFREFNNTASTHILLIANACLFIVGGLCALVLAYRQPISHVIITMAITSYLALITAWVIAPTISARSIKPLAADINVLLERHPDAVVVNFGNYHQDLPYYIHRLVIIVNWQNELTFGYHHQADAKNWMINTDAFWQLWQSPTRVYTIMSRQDYQRYQPQHSMHLIDETYHDVLVTNQETTL
jgi:4-amino-4-deoxy-L-arabinose transferase-like glycosyltransferase